MKRLVTIILLVSVALASACTPRQIVSTDLITEMDPATDAGFKASVQKSSLPVVVLFTAPECLPCKPVERVIDKVAPEFDGWVRFLKINTNTSESVAAGVNVDAIPTLQVYDGKKVRERRVGKITPDELSEILTSLLGI